MSPYFSTGPERAYKCQGCGGWFYEATVNCCVAHTPGTCCHFSEVPAPAPPPRTTSSVISGAPEKER